MMRVVRFIASEIETNSYFISAEKPAIIDPGTYVDVILGNLKKYIKLKELKYIILTHFHPDHAMAVPIIKKETDAEVLIHEEDAKFLDFKPNRILKDNEILDLGDVKLKVIHTPGHTPGGICLFEPKTKSLFSGDTVFSFGDIGRTDLIGGDIKKIIDSIKRLTKLDVKTLYPGHGEITNKDVNNQIKSSLQLSKLF